MRRYDGTTTSRSASHIRIDGHFRTFPDICPAPAWPTWFRTCRVQAQTCRWLPAQHAATPGADRRAGCSVGENLTTPLAMLNQAGAASVTLLRPRYQIPEIRYGIGVGAPVSRTSGGFLPPRPGPGR